MTKITLHNTKTRSKEELVPIKDGQVSMYVCGPTVYDRAHIGNARPVIVFDTLFRLLRHVYGEANVTYVRNFTDVDDKINATALARQEAGAQGTLEELIAQRTDETIGWYHSDMDAVGALRPSVEPRATEYIAQMVAMAEDLIAKGHAYAAEGHVLFAVDSYADYGKLSGRSVDDMIAGARVEVAPYKRNPMDFVIWKPSDEGTPGWDSPWGRGRPGWHIECSAMAHELLGKSFDIHGGGNDLMFPHHENEIAQSKCVGDDFASIWMHNEMLQVEGKKMSKSLGNFFTVRDLLDKGVPGEVIRFVFLSTHYRKPMDWTEKKAKDADQFLVGLYTKLYDKGLPNGDLKTLYKAEGLWQADTAVVAFLSDDLNTHAAIDRVRKMAKEVDWNSASNVASLAATLELLGFLSSREAIESYLQLKNNYDFSRLEKALQAARSNAMETKNFAPVDALKSSLIAAGVEVRMNKEGVELVQGVGFNPFKLEGLL